jgi:hypothetical protein
MLAFVPAVASATAPTADVIYIDGQQWWLMGRPLNHIDSTRYADFYSRLPEGRSVSTGNWGGYTCYWSLDGEWLVLDSVVYEVPYRVRVKVYNSDRDSMWAYEERPVTLSHTILLETLKDYCRDGKIVATWFTDTVRAVQGELVYDDLSYGWGRYFDTEIVLELKEGHVDKQTLYHNRVLVDGLDFNGGRVEQWHEFQSGFLSVLRKYSELDSERVVVFRMWDGVVDSLGDLHDIQVVVSYPEIERELSNRLEQELKQYLLNIRPWKVYFINGELVNTLKIGALIPFYLKR